MNTESVNEKLLDKVRELCREFSVGADINNESVLQKIISSDEPLIVDVGGYNGSSVRKYTELFPKSIIYSLEPFPRSYSQLCKLESNRVKTFNLGLSSHKGTETFYVNKLNETNSLLSFSKDVKDTWCGLEGLITEAKIECKFVTLDEFISAHEIKHVDLLKLDVQGAEFKVLEGSKNALSEKRIYAIQMELILADTYIGQKSMRYYFDLFKKFGYQPYSMTDFATTKKELLQCDIFFVSGK